MKKNSYHEVRVSYDKKRKILWSTLASFFCKKYINKNSTVLEIGASYCDFINSIKAKKKIALDSWSGVRKYADKNVQCIVGDVNNLKKIKNDTLDIVFASNLFEHLKKKDFELFLEQIKQKMRSDGKLIILQPNYKKCYKDYFDDYTHISIWTDVSLKDFLIANGFDVVESYPGFLPLSIKSKLPVIPILIKLYINLPLKPFEKQMLLISKLKKV